METYDIQKKIVDSISVAVESELSNFNTTNSTIGVVKETPANFTCKVELNGEDIDCLLPEHLHSWIEKGDIVIIQDLYNNGQKRIVVGKTGQLSEDPSLVFEDESTGKLMSGVDGIFDETGTKIEANGTVKNE